MKPWKTVQENVVFDASPYLKVLKQRVELPDGKTVDDFFQVHLRAFAVVVPVLPDGRILTIRQYKHGLGRVSLTFPAGFVEDGEAPDVAVRRELLEETGYEAQSLTHLGEFVDNGNQRGCVGNYYVATGCNKIAEPDSGDLEEMEIAALSTADIDAALANGDIGIIHQASAWALAKALNALPIIPET